MVAGHAPHSGLPKEQIKTWWQNLSKILQTKAEGWPIIIGVDANARTGSIQSDYLGGHQQSEENYGGTQLHELCAATETILPSTFERYQRGDGSTWMHPRGTVARLDYVGIPRQWTTCYITAHMDQSLAVNKSIYDHRPCAVNLKGRMEVKTFEARAKVKRSGTTRTLNFNNEEVRREITNRLQGFETPAWSTDVHTHLQDVYACLWDTIEDVAKKHGVDRRRKSHLTEATWELIQHKRFHRKALFDWKEYGRLEELKVYFLMWQGRWNEAAQTSEDTGDAHKNEAYHYHMFQTLGKQVNQCLRVEDEAFFNKFAEDLVKYDQPGLQRSLWKEIRRYLPRMKERKKSTPVEQMEGDKKRWSNYLCFLEAGETKAFQNLYQQCIDEQNEKALPGAKLSDTPTLVEMETFLRTSKTAKAKGMDQICGDMLHWMPGLMATLFWPITCKMAAHATEPIQWKGGRVKWLHKKGSWDSPENFRGILLASAVGKRAHAYYRQPLMKCLEEVKDAGQLGGFAHKETLYGNHYIRSLLRLAHAVNLASVVIFVDLSAAFHSLIREVVHGIDDLEAQHPNKIKAIETILTNITNRGGNPKKVQQSLGEQGYMQQIQTPEYLIQLVRELGRCNWAMAEPGEGEVEVVHTHKGTRPGSPLADTLFHFGMSQCSLEVMNAVADEDENTALCSKHNVTCRPVVWADDLAVCLISEDNEAIVHTAERVLAKIDRAFTKKGMEINYKKQKTEALFSFRGKKAAHQRRQWLSGDATTCHTQDPEGESAEFHRTATYKHLGIYHSCGGMLDMELKCRVAQAWGAWRELRTPLFGPKKLSKETKLRLASSLIFTKLLHGAETWPVLTLKQLKKVNACYTENRNSYPTASSWTNMAYSPCRRRSPRRGCCMLRDWPNTERSSYRMSWRLRIWQGRIPGVELCEVT